MSTTVSALTPPISSARTVEEPLPHSKYVEAFNKAREKREASQGLICPGPLKAVSLHQEGGVMVAAVETLKGEMPWG